MNIFFFKTKKKKKKKKRLYCPGDSVCHRSLRKAPRGCGRRGLGLSATGKVNIFEVLRKLSLCDRRRSVPQPERPEGLMGYSEESRTSLNTLTGIRTIFSLYLLVRVLAF